MNLKEYGFVKEFGEGIDRMCKELEDSGLPDPDYLVESFMLRCIVRGSEVMKKDEVPSNKKPEEKKRTSTTQKTAQKTAQKILGLVRADPTVTRQQLAGMLNLTADGIKYHLKRMQDSGILRRVGPDKGSHWEVVGHS